MDKHKKKRIKSIIAGVCVVAIVIVLAVIPALAGNAAQDEDAASILSAKAQYATLTRKILGGGVLTEEDSLEVTVPAAVKLTEFLVENGDSVKEGDPIARADRVSVMQAISQVQETLGLIADDIEKESEKTNTQTVRAEAGGTVKILYAEKGSSVRQVMLEHGALAVLSLDGKLAVQLEAKQPLETGTKVEVTLQSGEVIPGRVESNLDNTLVVSVTDEGYALDQTVTVRDEDGKRLGSGKLYILNAWNAVAYSGTVSEVKTSVGKTLSGGDALFKLEDTGYTAAYQQLCDEYRDYEELMLELFQMYQTQIVTAPCDGVVSGIDEDSAQLLAMTQKGFILSFLANAPNGDDEMLYYNYLGTVSTVEETEWAMNMDPNHLEITDYLDLSGLTIDPATMTEAITFPKDLVPVYEAKDGIWQQLEIADIAAGDVLLIACDEEGNFIWIVRVQTTPTDPEPTPPGPTEPTFPNYPNFPNMGQLPQFDMSGLYPQGGMQQEPTLYPMDTAQIAAVTPQQKMTLDITVDQQDMASLYPGQEVSVTVDALPGITFRGILESLGNTGSNTGGSSKFTVTVRLDRQENMLAGMQASATITLESVENVLTIPVEALAEEGNRTLVYTGYDPEKEVLTNPVEVITGLSDGEKVQILQGLSPEQTFWYAYYDTLQISNVAENDFDFSPFG